MTMTGLEVIAIATRVTRAALPILDIPPEKLTDAAQFQLEQRTGNCPCGKCPPLTVEEIKAIEASAALLLATIEYIEATKHAHKTAEVALVHIMKRQHY